MTIRRTEITVETRRVIVMSKRGSLAKVWCRQCNAQVGMLKVNDAALVGISLETIYRSARVGKLHVVEPDGESSFICLNSLLEKL